MNRRPPRITCRERDMLARRLREAPIIVVWREIAAAGHPRSFATLAKLAEADAMHDEARSREAVQP